MGNTNEFKTAVDQYLAFSHGQQPNDKKEYYKRHRTKRKQIITAPKHF